MEDLGLDVGDRVDVAIDRSASLQVTGEVVLNGAGLLDDLDSGEGAVLPDPAQQRLVGAEERDLSFPGAYLVRLDPAADRQAVLARMEREHPHTVARPLTPSQIDNLDPVAGLPALLAGLVAVLGTATVAHATATTVRRRRRDLAMLSGLGFVRRQVSGALAWQATAVALPGLLLGVPLGVAVGRWSWRLTADALWVVSPPRVPLVALGVVAVAAVVVVNAAALGAGVVGWRRSPAVALRAE
jgi:predicted lysophospholipase L1 biosynthesis ABC-type transport system permease subunit